MDHAARGVALRFDAGRHEYWIGERRVPGVSRILRHAGLVDASWWQPHHRDRGTVIHRWCLDHDLGLDPPDPGPALLPYVRAYRSFLDVMRPDYTEMELPVLGRVVHPDDPTQVLLYAGTLDRRAFLRRRDGLLDIKTGGRLQWHALQLAAYEMAIGVRPGRLRRWSLHLNSAGDFRLHEHAGVEDHHRFVRYLADYAGDPNAENKIADLSF
jgi:hypothetical protein